MPTVITVRAGSDDAFIAWTSDFVPDCRGFALYRRIKRSPHSASSPNTVAEPDAEGFVEEVVASWVGFCQWPGRAAGNARADHHLAHSKISVVGFRSALR